MPLRAGLGPRQLPMRESWSRSRRRPREKKGKASEGQPNRATPRTPKTAAPVGAAVPSSEPRAGPSGLASAPTRDAMSGRRGAQTPKRAALSTPGTARERTPARAASSAVKAGASSRKKKKKGSGVGVETPTPTQARSAARARTPGTPTVTAPAVRPAGTRAGGRNSAVKKAAKPVGAGTGVPSDQLRRKKKRKKKAIRKRLPRTAAVAVTMVAVGDREAPKFSEVMRNMREVYPDLRTAFGIKEVRPKRAATGGFLLEIPGAAASQQADALAASLRDMFPEDRGVRISRPVRKVDLRITGFDDSVTPQEIAEAISQFDGRCGAEDVRVGMIRSSRDGLCTVWAQAPAIAGVPAAEAGKLRLGWARARVALLKGRPLRCFRCLAPGHVQQRCPCPVDRARCCFNCGGSDHVVAACRNRSHCPSCYERGRNANHKPGSTSCVPVGPRRGAPPPPPQRTPSRGERGATASDAVDTPGPSGRGAPSQGSSPLSPPGKRACVAGSSSPDWLPQRLTRPQCAGQSGDQPPPEAVAEVDMEEPTGWGEVGDEARADSPLPPPDPQRDE